MAADIATRARPYARAAFAGAGSTAGGLLTWSTMLNRASEVVADARVAALIGNPRVAPAELLAFLHELCDTRADAPTGNFLHLLADNDRLRLLPEITAQFEVLRAAAERQADVDVTSAIELTAEQQQQLSAALTRRLGCAVRLHQRLDKALIGGAIVRHGDLVFDGSLRGRVERLATAITGA